MSKSIALLLLFIALGAFVYFNPDVVDRLLAPSDPSGEFPATTGVQEYSGDGGFEATAAERAQQPGYGSASDNQPYAGPPQGMPLGGQCEEVIATMRDSGELVRRVEEEMQGGTFESQKYWYDCLRAYETRPELAN